MSTQENNQPLPNFKFYSRYPNAYRALMVGLEHFANDRDLENLTYKQMAQKVIEEINETHSYISNHQERISQFLQGLGLSIPYSYYDIFEMAMKDGQLKESDSDTKRQRIADNYWRFMAMRLIHIAESKEAAS